MVSRQGKGKVILHYTSFLLLDPYTRDSFTMLLTFYCIKHTNWYMYTINVYTTFPYLHVHVGYSLVFFSPEL